MRRPHPGVWTGLFGLPITVLTWGHWILDRWILEPFILRPMDWLMERTTKGYAILLRHALRHQWWVMPSSVALAATALVFVLGVNVPLPAWAEAVRSDVDR